MAPTRLGLALGSGSARGWSHIGVIEALAEVGIEADIVCGTSIGALVGAAYTLAPVADRIRQDVLILEGTEDHFIPFHQTADFEKALVNARSVTTRIFDGPSGGAGHCQPGALTLYHAAVFDWLLEKFPTSPRG